MMIGSRNGFMTRGGSFDPYSLSGLYVAGDFLQNFNDAQKDKIALNAGLRYKLLLIEPVPTVLDGSTVLSCDLLDCAINTVPISTDEYPVYIRLPEAPSDGRSRDFLLRLEITAPDSPEITIETPEEEEIDFECIDSDWSQFSPGINFVSFTETRNALIR